MLKLSDYINQSAQLSAFGQKAVNSFVILSDIEQRIKEKIEKAGTPLRDWDINIYRGILTGYNEAFIIDGKTKDILIAKSSKNADIIRPILRGRDIKRYGYEFADLWLIYVPWHFPLHKDPTISGASKEAEAEFQKQYPDIYNHLLQYKEQLSNRNKAETGIRYEWYALQRWGANYMDDFSKQKIVYPNMTKFMPFYLDNQGFYQNDKSFMITGGNIAYLTAFLNSSLFKYCFLDNFPELQGGTRELRKIFLDKIPVKNVSTSENMMFDNKITEIQELRKNNLDTREKEVIIDNMIFDLYQLTDNERKLIGFIEIL